MTQIDVSQLLNADGSPLTDEQVAALTPAPAAATPPAPAPAPAAPEGPTRADTELAIARAGFNLADPIVGALAKGYDGDLEPATIVASFAAVNILPTGAPAGEIIDPSKTAAGGQADTRQALAGGDYVPPPPPPEKTAYERAGDAIARARGEGYDEPAQRMVGIQEILGAAIGGDQAVTVGVRHEERKERWRQMGELSNTA